MAALISVDRAKESIADAVNSDDPILSTMVDAATAAIEKWCNRKFAKQAYDETYNGTGMGYLLLKQTPIVSLERVATAKSAALRIENTDDSTNQRATVAVTSTGLSLTRVASGVSSTDTSVTWASNVTVADVATAVNALGNGWAGEAVTDFEKWASADLVAIQGALDCLAREVDIHLYDEELTSLSLDPDVGELRGTFPIGYKNVRVQYTAGHATVPVDVQQACAELVAEWFRERSRDGSLIEEKLGDESWKRADPSSTLSLSKRIKGLLMGYKDYA